MAHLEGQQNHHLQHHPGQPCAAHGQGDGPPAPDARQPHRNGQRQGDPAQPQEVRPFKEATQARHEAGEPQGQVVVVADGRQVPVEAHPRRPLQCLPDLDEAVGGEKIADVRRRHPAGGDPPFGPPPAPEVRVGHQRVGGSQEVGGVPGQRHYRWEDGAQGMVDAPVPAGQFRTPVVLRRRKSHGQDAARVQDGPDFPEELLRVEPVQRARGRLRQVQDDHVKGLAGRLDKPPTVGQDDGHPRIVQDGGLVGREVETGGPQEQWVGFHDGDVDPGVAQGFPQVARRRAADKEDFPGGRMGQERQMDDFFGRRPLGLKHQQAVLVEDTLAIPGLDDDAPVGGVGGEGQVRPLPAEGGAMKGGSKRQEGKKQEGKEQNGERMIPLVAGYEAERSTVQEAESGGQVGGQDERGGLEGVQVADEDETEERAPKGRPSALPEVGAAGRAAPFGQVAGQEGEERPGQQADRRDGQDHRPHHRPELYQGAGRDPQKPPRGAHQEHLEDRHQAESNQSSGQNLMTTRSKTARQSGAQRPPGQPGGQDQAQDQFVAVEDGDQFPHQQDLGNGGRKTESQKRDQHRWGGRKRQAWRPVLQATSLPFPPSANRGRLPQSHPLPAGR